MLVLILNKFANLSSGAHKSDTHYLCDIRLLLSYCSEVTDLMLQLVTTPISLAIKMQMYFASITSGYLQTSSVVLALIELTSTVVARCLTT